ncbi:MAG: heavy-metal-associated domain-containing protein [Chloroflexaceae bacterium]|nr:heavy-metal-associated domain-containing protein [Chloroflexaceae bacterium]
MVTERFQVPGISCQHCVNAVKKEVAALSGVQSVQVELSDKSVTVEHNGAISADTIIAAINEAGYDEVIPVTRNP